MDFSVAIYTGKNVPYDLSTKLLGLTLLERQIKIAQAYGIPFMRIRNNNGLDKAIDEFLAAKGPMLAECMIDPADTVK